MVLTERFTRLDEQRLEYEWTVEIWRCLKINLLLSLRCNLPMTMVYEYACHEANYAMPLMLSGARKQEANGEEDDTWLPSWSR